jgi:hypothetical protein
MKIRRRYRKEYGEIFYTVRYTNIYHRDDGPARIFVGDGRYRTYFWYRYGELHRVGGPALDQIFSDGTFRRSWVYKGLLHREDGPAQEGSKYKYWYYHGLIHRVDGPATIVDDMPVQWWLNGKLFEAKEAWFEALTPEQQQKMLFSEYFIN